MQSIGVRVGVCLFGERWLICCVASLSSYIVRSIACGSSKVVVQADVRAGFEW